MNDFIKILFLAKYAPKDINQKLPLGIEDKTYAMYHHRIYQILSSEFKYVLSSNSVDNFLQQKPNVDFVFSLYNRIPFRNSEVFISSVCEYYKIPYLGATPNIRAVAEDKHLAKINAKNLGINTPDWCIVDENQDLINIPFDGPYFVKPRFGATSIDIDNTSFCEDLKQVRKKLMDYKTKKVDVIIEKYIKGTSITVPVLNNFGNTIVLPYVIEHSEYNHNIITYKQKRKIVPGLVRIVCNDLIKFKIVEKIALTYFDSVQPLDYTRIDFIIEQNTNLPYFIEYNICCNLGEHAAINISAKSLGIDYKQLIDNITYSSLYRQKVINSTFGKEF